jgi:hypothetical protein
VIENKKGTLVENKKETIIENKKGTMVENKKGFIFDHCVAFYLQLLITPLVSSNFSDEQWILSVGKFVYVKDLDAKLYQML